MKLGYKSYLYLIVLTMLSLNAAYACLPQINWGASVSFCQGNSFTLNAANANATYVWSTGASTPSISVNSSGIYWVSVTNNCGTTSDTIQVIVDQPVTVNLGQNRAICAGSSTMLSAPFSPSSTYMWQNGFTGHQLNVTTAGTYHVSVTNACGTYSDTVQISIDQSQNVNLGADVVNCTTNSSVLQLPSGVSGSIKWSTGAKTSSITVNKNGSYWVKVTNACGVFSDTINVAFVSAGKLFPNDTILFCNTGSIKLSSPVSVGSHLWSTNATNSSIQVSQSGKYWLTLTLPCGTFSDTVYLIGSTINSVNLGPDITMCQGAIAQLDAGNPGSTFIWSTGATSQAINVDSSAIYWVGANNGCGWVYDTLQVMIQTGPTNPVPDTVFTCAGSFGVADAGSWGPNTTYQWSNSATTQINTTLSVGLNWVRVMNPCDTVFKVFRVKTIPPATPNLGKDTAVCANSLVIFSRVPLRGNTFMWSTGNTTQNYTVSKSGTYWVRVTNACGTSYDTISVTLVKAPKEISQDTIYKCSGQGIWVKTTSRAATTYLWNNGSTLYKTFITTPGKYWYTASNICGTVTDTVYVVDNNVLRFSLGKDTTFCAPNKLVIPLTHPDVDSVLYSGVLKKSYITLNKSGRYWVKVYSKCGVYNDTIKITVNKPADKLLRDTSYCGSGSVMLDATQPQALSYSWNTGAVTSSISVNSIGWYYVDITTLCGVVRDSTFINQVGYLPKINLGKDTLFCAGQLVLDPGYHVSSRYLWNTGDTTQTIIADTTGNYIVKVANGCGSEYDTIRVDITGPPYMALGNSVKFCAGSTLNLNAQNPGCTYLWNTGDTLPTLSVTQPGKYWVTMTNDCGTLTDSITVIVESPLSMLSLGNDTIICMGDSVELSTGIPGVYTKWKNGSNLPNMFVTQTGDYWVQVSNSCGTWNDTVHVEVLDIPGYSLGNDTAICAGGGSLLLNGPPNMETYQWQDASTGPNFLVTAPGKYWLTVFNGCFSYTDTINVSEDYPIEIDLGHDTTLCEGETLLLHSALGKGNGKNIDTSQVSSSLVTESGVYWLAARNSCGNFSDTIVVNFEKIPDVLTEDTLICSGDTAIIDLSDLKNDYKWFDGSTESIRKFGESGVYNLTVSNTCGDYVKSFNVTAVNCECPFFIPNAFTPNGDGTNDEFKIGHSCPIATYKMLIYNRWGQLAFETDNPDEGWTGFTHGSEAAEGMYTYKIYYEWYVYGVDRSKEHTGTLTLMR